MKRLRKSAFLGINTENSSFSIRTVFNLMPDSSVFIAKQSEGKVNTDDFAPFSYENGEV